MFTLRTEHSFKKLEYVVKLNGNTLGYGPTASTAFHTLVSIHLVTEQKSQFVPGFVEKIKGLEDEESKTILDVFSNNLNNSHD